MITITVHKKDSVSFKVECERGIAKEISSFFTFKVPGYEFMPAYKNGMWDGAIKLFNVHNYELYVGLYDYLQKFCKDRGYQLNGWSPNPNRSITKEQIKSFIDDHLKPTAMGSNIEAHEHQCEGVAHAINKNRCLLISPTGSGKSLMIYSLIRYYLDTISESQKILVIVPTTSLVSQMYSDFSEYSKENGWRVDKNCHKVTSGKDKLDPDKRVTISTWQSIHKLDRKYFSNYDAVIGDECHLFKAKSLTSIMTKLTNCKYRIGTTGTLDGTQCHRLVIEGLFGTAYQVTSTEDLIKDKILSDFSIDCIMLNHNERFKKENKRLTYQEELDAIVGCKARNDFITNLSNNVKGNTLVLFQYVAKHGRPLYEQIKETCKDKEVYFIHGGTDTDLREKIRKVVEKKDNAIIVASYGTFSTGVSIRKLHNIIFASPSKSRIRVLQSIGRQLRKSEHKGTARLYDISDNICWKKYKNHTYRHYEERVKIYESENFNYKSVVINISE